MMRVVRDRVSDKSSDVGFEILHSPISGKCCSDHPRNVFPAFGKRTYRLPRCHGQPVELLRVWTVLIYYLEPHNPHIVNMGDDCRNGSALDAGRFGAPRIRVEVLDQVASNVVVGRISIQQRVVQDKRLRFSFWHRSTSMFVSWAGDQESVFTEAVSCCQWPMPEELNASHSPGARVLQPGCELVADFAQNA